MKNLAMIMLCLGTLAGCVSTDERYNAQGNMVYEVRCSFRSVDTCLEEAGGTCGILGYTQVQKDGSPMPPAPASAQPTPPPAARPEPSQQAALPGQQTQANQQDPSQQKPPLMSRLKETIGYDRKIYVKCGHTYQPDS